MKENLSTAARILPFCIPFPLIFLAVDYYLNDEQSWIAIAAAVFLGVISFGYALMGKTAEMFAGDSVGFLISSITTSYLNNGFDESFFKPLTSISYLHSLINGIILFQIFAILAVKICKKAKSNNKKYKGE